MAECNPEEEMEHDSSDDSDGPSAGNTRKKPQRECPFCSDSFTEIRRHVKICKGKLKFAMITMIFICGDSETQCQLTMKSGSSLVSFHI